MKNEKIFASVTGKVSKSIQGSQHEVSVLSKNENSKNLYIEVGTEVYGRVRVGDYGVNG